MRGTPAGDNSAVGPAGLIPTYAGNTACGFFMTSLQMTHPHVCGEHGRTITLGGYFEGSSPRMRGTLIGEFPVGDKFGLIPTYAGNTCA